LMHTGKHVAGCQAGAPHTCRGSIASTPEANMMIERWVPQADETHLVGRGRVSARALPVPATAPGSKVASYADAIENKLADGLTMLAPPPSGLVRQGVTRANIKSLRSTVKQAPEHGK
jgi:hypothetical protein